MKQCVNGRFLYRYHALCLTGPQLWTSWVVPVKGNQNSHNAQEINESRWKSFCKCSPNLRSLYCSPRLCPWHCYRPLAAFPGQRCPHWDPGFCCATQQPHPAASPAASPAREYRSPPPFAGRPARAFPSPPTASPSWHPGCAAVWSATVQIPHRPSGTRSSGAKPTRSDCTENKSNHFSEGLITNSAKQLWLLETTNFHTSDITSHIPPTDRWRGKSQIHLWY